MSLRKVQPDTSWAGKCKDCQYAHVREQETGQRTLLCNAVYPIVQTVRTRVETCNDFKANVGSELTAMKEIAWMISSDRKNKIGFFSPAEWKALKKENGVPYEPD